MERKIIFRESGFPDKMDIKIGTALISYASDKAFKVKIVDLIIPNIVDCDLINPLLNNLKGLDPGFGLEQYSPERPAQAIPIWGSNDIQGSALHLFQQW